jgi:hypothetical protein
LAIFNSGQIEEFRMRRRIAIESMVDKIIEGKRRKGRGVIPDRNAVIQDELAKITSLPYEMIKIDFSTRLFLISLFLSSCLMHV